MEWRWSAVLGDEVYQRIETGMQKYAMQRVEARVHVAISVCIETIPSLKLNMML